MISRALVNRCQQHSSVKIINPKNSGGNIVESWQVENAKLMSRVLGEEFADLIKGNNYGFGYNEDGAWHEWKTEAHREC